MAVRDLSLYSCINRPLFRFTRTEPECPLEDSTRHRMCSVEQMFIRNNVERSFLNTECHW